MKHLLGLKRAPHAGKPATDPVCYLLTVIDVRRKSGVYVEAVVYEEEARRVVFGLIQRLRDVGLATAVNR